jgi:hypothetical protein
MVQTSLGKKQGPISTITRAKRAGGGAQTVSDLPSKYEALSSNPSTTKKVLLQCVFSNKDISAVIKFNTDTFILSIGKIQFLFKLF